MGWFREGCVLGFQLDSSWVALLVGSLVPMGQEMDG